MTTAATPNRHSNVVEAQLRTLATWIADRIRALLQESIPVLSLHDAEALWCSLGDALALSDAALSAPMLEHINAILAAHMVACGIVTPPSTADGAITWIVCSEDLSPTDFVTHCCGMDTALKRLAGPGSVSSSDTVIATMEDWMVEQLLSVYTPAAIDDVKSSEQAYDLHHKALAVLLNTDDVRCPSQDVRRLMKEVWVSVCSMRALSPPPVHEYSDCTSDEEEEEEKEEKPEETKEEVTPPPPMKRPRLQDVQATVLSV